MVASGTGSLSLVGIRLVAALVLSGFEALAASPGGLHSSVPDNESRQAPLSSALVLSGFEALAADDKHD